MCLNILMINMLILFISFALYMQKKVHICKTLYMHLCQKSKYSVKLLVHFFDNLLNLFFLFLFFDLFKKKIQTVTIHHNILLIKVGCVPSVSLPTSVSCEMNDDNAFLRLATTSVPLRMNDLKILTEKKYIYKFYIYKTDNYF